MFPKHALLSIHASIWAHSRRLRKFSQHSPFRCIHIFFKNWCYDQWIFFKEKLEVNSFQKLAGFSVERYIFCSCLLLFICLNFFKNEGLLRCGKSCRLRWINYLRADVKRGNITPEEEEIIVKLHAVLGNRWCFAPSYQMPLIIYFILYNFWIPNAEFFF